VFLKTRIKAIHLFSYERQIASLQDGGTMMRHLALVSMVAGATMLAGTAWGQAMTEFGAAAAGGSIGGAGGKKVSDGLTSIFGKVGAQTEKAAATDKPTAVDKAAKQPALEVSPGVPKASDTGDVPPPP
jgi:hypothetical protein